MTADSDGIVCIPSVRGARPAADRLLDLVSDAYADQWTHDTLPQFRFAVGYAGKTIESRLRDGFFSQHRTRFNHRPFLTVPDVKNKGAGCLRDNPNINWNKDRGNDAESAPWYNLGLKYGGKPGDWIGDHHVRLVEETRAREYLDHAH